jgi:hypothetical protein
MSVMEGGVVVDPAKFTCTCGLIAHVREKDNAAGPEWVPLSSSVGGRDAAAPYEALRCDAIVAISKGSTRPRYFTVFLLLLPFFQRMARRRGEDRIY